MITNKYAKKCHEYTMQTLDMKPSALIANSITNASVRKNVAAFNKNNKIDNNIIKAAKNLKERLSYEDTLRLIDFIGHKFNRNGKFRLREDERTASASVRKRDNYIKDFGSDWGGDIFALLMEFHGLTFTEAVDYVNNCVGGVK